MALYDPREFPETVSPDFTLEEFLAWVRTKPADEAYDYCSTDFCAVARFGIETRRPGLIDLYYEELQAISPALEEAVVERPWTFGALAARLEAELAQ